MARLAEVGIDHFVIIPFTSHFSRISSFEFVRDILIEKLNTKLLVIGHDHQFGRNREGSISDLEECALAYNFEIEQIEAQTVENINISSTKIRKAIDRGDFKVANAYLGYEFRLSGQVVHGNKMGRSMGFPTANLRVDNDMKIIPANGVYAVEVIVKGVRYGGMLNIGDRPTVEISESKTTMEVHIFDFDIDIYDEWVQVFFKYRIRNEHKFDSIDALVSQLAKDKEKSLQLLINP